MEVTVVKKNKVYLSLQGHESIPDKVIIRRIESAKGEIRPQIVEYYYKRV